eukprot:TRINITY_DN25735_c0_g1_i1.p1 TRINITY_DN25735_c0_g1~~TRINITY_DN25735_c0_g1_i1.p1  ORF type:complete len:479 (+),score=84.77 TRINITY_DN25735_c0_g1_i1:97-1533(+)
MEVIDVGTEYVYWWQPHPSAPFVDEINLLAEELTERDQLEKDQLWLLFNILSKLLFAKEAETVSQSARSNISKQQLLKRFEIEQSQLTQTHSLRAELIRAEQLHSTHQTIIKPLSRSEVDERLCIQRQQLIASSSLQKESILCLEKQISKYLKSQHLSHLESIQRTRIAKAFTNSLRQQQKIKLLNKESRRQIKRESEAEMVSKSESEKRSKIESEYWSKIRWVIRKMKSAIILFETTERTKLEQTALRGIVRKKNCLRASQEVLEQQHRRRQRDLLRKSNSVPSEVVQLILGWLTLFDRTSLSRTCSAMRCLVRSHEGSGRRIVISSVIRISRIRQRVRKYIHSVRTIQIWWKTTTTAIRALEELSGSGGGAGGILSRRRQNRNCVLEFDKLFKARVVLFPNSSLQKETSPMVTVLTSLTSECWICELSDADTHMSRCLNCSKVFHETCGVNKSYCLKRCAAATAALAPHSLSDTSN